MLIRRLSLQSLLATCLAVVRVAPSALLAQSNTGTILGTVQDDTGAAVPDAALTIRNLGTGEIRTVRSDNGGSYNVPNLQVGHYSITVSRDGFAQTQIADTELQVAQRATINPVLHLGA